MTWKCDKCGMPNFSDENCKLCGAPKPENPEEFIEEMTPPKTDDVPVPEAEEIVFDSHPDADEAVTEPEPAVVEEPLQEEPAVVEELTQEEPAAEEEPEIIPEEADTQEDVQATVVPPANADSIADGAEKGKKKPILTVIICLIILALLCAFGLYMRAAKDASTSENTPSANPTAENVDVTIPSETPSEEPVDAPTEEAAIQNSDVALETESAVNTEPDVETIPPKPVETLEPAKTPKPVATPKPADTPKPIATPKPTPEPWNDHYKKFVSDDFGFYCAYPAEFTLTKNNANDILLTAVSPDETAIMTIQGSKNWNKLSAEEALNRFIGMFNGEVRYRDNGNTWYAASVKVGERVYYRKAFLRGGNIYCFDFEYNYKDSKIYSPYIEYIEDHFKRN